MIDPTSGKASGYYLFLEPSGKNGEELQAVIKRLATDYGGPVFVPHVTLLSAIKNESEEQLIEKGRSFALQCTALTITLSEADTEDTYFRSLYLRIREREILSALNGKAAEAFSMDPDPAYLPHLSLLYGNYPEEQKKGTISDLHIPAGMSFVADTISLWHNEGEVAEWVRIASFPMGNP